MNADEIHLSVIVCTRNRASRLDTCFDHIVASGRQSSVAWELIVVDNGSTDDTPAVVARWAQRRDLAIVATRQSFPGLAIGRNTGVRSAHGMVLAFVDDDCVVEPSWMTALVAAYRASPRPDLVGGRVELGDMDDAPLAIRPFDEPAEVIDFDTICGRLIGCNFSVDARALKVVGPFDERLGTGTPAQSAEDFDLFYRMLRAGMCLRYEPSIRLRHHHGRRSIEDVARLRRGYVRGRGALYAKHILRGDVDMLRHLYWELRTLARPAQTLTIGTDAGDPVPRLACLRDLIAGGLSIARHAPRKVPDGIVRQR